MARKTHKLCFDPSDDYRILTISSPLPEYKLVFFLNKTLLYKFVFKGTFIVKDSKGSHIGEFYLYHYMLDDYTDFFLAGPVSGGATLSREHHLIIKGAVRKGYLGRIMEGMQRIEGIFDIFEIEALNPDNPPVNQRQRRYFDYMIGVLYDLEYFLMDYERSGKAVLLYSSEIEMI